jgi:hypothetical protein
MRFEKGNKLAKGGRRNPPGGRPTKAQAAEKESFRQALERKREERAEELAGAYYDMALADPATMRHAVDKVLPTLTEENIIAPPTIIFAPFAHNRHPPQLPAQDIPVTVQNKPAQLPAPDGQEGGGEGAAPALKFLNFSNVKRQK